MKAFVIAIENHEKSQKVANRCIQSASKFDIHVEKWKATTPDDYPVDILLKEDVAVAGFQEIYSRIANCTAAFHSHYSLWKHCVDIKEDVMILEHDAVFVNSIPKVIMFDRCISLGHPSYGKFNVPTTFGVNPLISKSYFPGAHAYIVKPSGAKEIIKKAKQGVAKPTDIFLNKNNFPWLQEYFPWPVEARDTFTTIQNVTGCLAKHSYGDDYVVEEV